MTDHEPNKSLLLQLRNAAQVERDELVRFNMRTIADDIQSSLTAFAIKPNSENMTKLNGLWARGIRQLGFATSVDPGSGGAKMRVAA